MGLKNNFTFIIISICMFMAICVSVNRCTDAERIARNNIIALTDSIEYYKGKNGELVAEKTLLIGSMNDLKIANENLYNEIKSMKVNKPSAVVKIESVIQNEVHDTVIVEKSAKSEFAFTNEWRDLRGIIYDTNSDSLGITLTKDEMYFDYTLAIKDSKLYMTSSNPYVKFNSATGIVIPENTKYESKKRWSLGPSLNIGYNPFSKSFEFTAGASLNLSLIRF